MHFSEILIISDNSLIVKEYSVIFLFVLVALALTLVILSASYLLAKQNPEFEKLSAYECGFEPYEDSRHFFDVRFCVIAILFIIFDIEIMFLILWSVSLSKMDLLGFWVVLDFLIELGAGFFYVWFVKALDWF